MASTHRISWLVTVALATVVGCHGDGGDVVGTRTVTGNGTIVSEDRVVSGFTAVTHAGEGSVHITVGGQEALRIEVDENLLQHIITQVQGGVLQILTAANVDIVPTTTVQYFISVMELESVILSGVGSIEVSGLTVDRLSLTLSGVGDIDCSGLDVVELQTVLSGVGNVDCDGQVDVQTVTVTGVGSYDAPNLASREARVTVGNSGSATVNVSERLEATATGNGSVTYVDSSGGGLVVQCTPASACTPAA